MPFHQMLLYHEEIFNNISILKTHAYEHNENTYPTARTTRTAETDRVPLPIRWQS